MYKKIFSKKFQKSISKIKGKELEIIFKKINEILNCSDINHYKNLKNKLKQYKRVHLNKSFVMLFFEKKNTIYFDSYEHHDKVYE